MGNHDSYSDSCERVVGSNGLDGYPASKINEHACRYFVPPILHYKSVFLSTLVIQMCLNSGGYVQNSKNRAKTSDIKFLYEIKAIKLSEKPEIEGYGKVSCCYEKNISQDTTCRKTFVIGCAEKILSGLGRADVCNSV